MNMKYRRWVVQTLMVCITLFGAGGCGSKQVEIPDRSVDDVMQTLTPEEQAKLKQMMDAQEKMGTAASAQSDHNSKIENPPEAEQ